MKNQIRHDMKDAYGDPSEFARDGVPKDHSLDVIV